MINLCSKVCITNRDNAIIFHHDYYQVHRLADKSLSACIKYFWSRGMDLKAVDDKNRFSLHLTLTAEKVYILHTEKTESQSQSAHGCAALRNSFSTFRVG